VSDLVETTRSTYAGYENDYAPPDVFILMKLAKLYNVSTDYILIGENGFYIPDEFKKILSEIDPLTINSFWTHLLEFAKYLSKK
jgi:transcriptional regulator with XRE-family HTH domain